MSAKKISFLVLLATLFLPIYVSAQLVSFGPNMTIERIILGILNKIWIIFGAFAVIMFIWAGITFLTSQGAPQKIEQARAAVLWGVVGVIVGIISYSIITIVGNIIGV